MEKLRIVEVEIIDKQCVGEKMNPVREFDQITQEILNKYDYSTITVGILIADGNQAAARDYIINYMDIFDKKSGKYIDFFVPGYCEKISKPK